jgi:hypothetical protein
MRNLHRTVWRLTRLFSQNLIGISVIGSDYDKLKRFNLAEIYTPTPKPQALEPENESWPKE